MSEKINTITGEIISGHSGFQCGGNIAELFEALSATQAEVEDLIGSEKGVKNRYRYAPLEQVVQKNRHVWTKHGLSISHMPVTASNPNMTAIRIIVGHKGGGYLTDICEMSNALIEGAQMSPQQQEGMVISYIRRYSLNGILQLAQEDDDAGADRTPATASTGTGSSAPPTNKAPDLSDVESLPGNATPKQKTAILAIRNRKDLEPEQKSRLEAKLIAGMSFEDASKIIGYYKEKDQKAKENPAAIDNDAESWDN